MENLFQATNPVTGEILPGFFPENSESEVDQACRRAADAFSTYRKLSGTAKAQFLEQIADELMALDNELIERARQETSLSTARLTSERTRTTNQLRLFAEYIREGSWIDARIDTALPDRQPLPRPSLRQMLIPLGPVGVFGASNFPLAFSVAGGDTASALAAGCPVVVKAHPAHPGTSNLVGQAILKAAETCGLPGGVFSLVHGIETTVGMALVKHPMIKAIGFTGSFRAGKALYNAAVRRLEPIPVYAEMSSTNPVFILPGALQARGATLAQAYIDSVTLGVGQFCTNPGLAIIQKSPAATAFLAQARDAIMRTNPAPMLTKNIQQAYITGLKHLTQLTEVDILGQAQKNVNGFTTGIPTLLVTNAHAFLTRPELETEVFGPSSLLIEADSKEQLLDIAGNLEGHLTATVHGTDEELVDYADLLELLEQKVGRLLINGFPTGVEVSHAMNHGGPYPATTDGRSTSVGTNAIRRFARPICYQNFPDSLLPDELKASNPLGIWRLIDGMLTKESL